MDRMWVRRQNVFAFLRRIYSKFFYLPFSCAQQNQIVGIRLCPVARSYVLTISHEFKFTLD